MLKVSLLMAAVFGLTVPVSAQAGARLPISAGSFGFHMIATDAVASADELHTTHIRRGLLGGLLPPLDIRGADAADDDPPLNRPVPESLQRFANADNRAKAGWTNTLGLLPQPETKVSLPSPDIRLQERGIHLGAIYRF